MDTKDSQDSGDSDDSKDSMDSKDSSQVPIRVLEGSYKDSVGSLYKVFIE